MGESLPLEAPNGTEMEMEFIDLDEDEHQVEDGEAGLEDHIDSDDSDLNNLIRIRNQDDGIFETEEEDSDYDFVMPEVEVELLSSPPPSRKRKQEIKVLGDGNDVEFVEINNDTANSQRSKEDNESSYFHDRKRERVPLYLLNPQDYASDPKKQSQIRRAIITYRHHQDKKIQIIKLTDENQKLRQQVDSLKLKLLEVSSCGCEKNKKVDLSVLDVNIPVVPPRMYIRGNRPVLAAPYHKLGVTPQELPQTNKPVVTVASQGTIIKQEPVDTWSSPRSAPVRLTPPTTSLTIPTPVTGANLPKMMKNLNSKAVSSNLNQTTNINKEKLQTGKGTPLATLPTSSIQNGPVRAVTTVTTSRQNFVMPAIKIEPGTSTLPQKIAPEKNTPPTPVTSSRIVFANKAAGSSSSMQTASQLLFASKIASRNPVVTTTSQPLTASQLALANRNRPIAPNTGPNETIFRTASGQILKMISAANLPQKPQPIGPPGLQIIPNRIKSNGSQPRTVVKASVPTPTEGQNRKGVEHVWNDDADEDEDLNIIAAVTGICPPSRNRKQAIGIRSPSEETHAKKRIIKAGGREIELNKYADIVFEEAN